MGNKKSANLLADGLFGKTRQAVLSFLYGHTDHWFYTEQIMDAVKIGRGTVQRELKNLTEAGIINRDLRGRQVYYQANEKCPIFDELKGVVRKTFGIADVVKQSLEPVKDKIRIAFIFGSIARGDEDKASDIDVMVIGKISFGDVVSHLHEAEEKLRRELNAIVYPVAEFKRKVKEDHHFVKAVLEGEKIFLIGEEDELARLVK